MRIYMTRRSYRRLENEGTVSAKLYTDTPIGNEQYVVLAVSGVDYADGISPGQEKLWCEDHQAHFDTRQKAGVHAGNAHGLTLMAALDIGVIRKPPVS